MAAQHVDVDNEEEYPQVYVAVTTDAAETPLYESLVKALGSSLVKREHLHLGDCVVKSSSGPVHEYVLERKTWSDFAASIQDGRYREQKTRFLESLTAEEAEQQYVKQFLYILETQSVKSFDGVTRNMSNKAINAAVLKTALRDQMHVLYSFGTDHSMQIIKYVFECVQAGELHPSTRKGGMAGAKGGKKRKRHNLEDPKMQLRAMFASVSGMSDNKAEALVKAYPTLGTLVKASAKDVADVACGSKRLGPVLAARILALCN